MTHPHSRASWTRALPLLFASLLGIVASGCDKGQINAPQGGIQWTRITDPATTPNPFNPVWGTDRIAFETFNVSSRTARIWTVRPDGSGLSALPRATSLGSDAAPQWIDDTTLVFTSDQADRFNFDLWYETLSGATLRRFTEDPTNDWDPAPRPGTPGLAFVEGPREYQGRITLIADTADVPLARTYLTPAELRAGEPSWDPSGQRVCFSVDSVWSDTTRVSRHIWLVDLSAGGVPVKLTTGPFLETSPVFSPDGSKILFVSNRTGRSGLWTVSPAGEGTALNVVTFADAGSEIYSPCWSPDGTRIVIAEYHGTTSALWVLSNLP